MARSFLGPFIVTFAIAIFVLMMQVLWMYLDDIAGRGLSFFTVIELMSYKCVGLVPLALPLALLISSVMVLGGMAEHYELSSFKSAGTSLLRVMRVLIIFGVIAAGVSFACADYVMPVANLQFGARMYDISNKKPTLNMEPGVFNEDFNQYAIRLGTRATDGRNIEDVLIYDHTKAATGELGQIIADRGEMYTENDGQQFVMKLYDGVQYSEQRQSGSKSASRPFVRTRFRTYTKVFDLSEFNLAVTDTKLFSTNRSMLATWQLQEAVDSIDADIAFRQQGVSNYLLNYLPLLPRDTVVYRKRKEKPEDVLPTMPDSATLARNLAEEAARRGTDIIAIDNRNPNARPPSAQEEAILLMDRRARAEAKANAHPLVRAAANWHGVGAAIDSVGPTLRERVFSRARSGVRGIMSQSKGAQRILPGIKESRVKHIYDLHMKYSMALVCIIFIFIGAPMGAIVRKGGFGYPILVSIIFFVIFIILTIFCRKLAESFVVDATFAGWLPCIILFPVSLYITERAMRDAKLVNVDGLLAVVKGGLARLLSRK